ncbi:beta-1,6-N-acetylglucosaminyltransferase [Carnobacterium sp.]|uniref:beta-1,6-N-acetylglucosaminyltransferase n=1 Tax=Carnobacterium sp. TaxID=48221 RepID=UPI003C77B607
MRGKHAYLIMAHNQYDLLEQLIFQLDDERNDIYIHVDKKATNFNSKHFEQLSLKSALYLIPRIDIKWGGYSQIQCELALLKEANKKKYRYFHLLSGADFPLKTQNDIHDFFEKHDGKEFIHFSKIEYKETKKIVSRISRYHLFQDFLPKISFKPLNYLIIIVDKLFLAIQRLFGINRLKNKNLTVKFGSSWFSVTDEFVKYVLSHQEWIKKYFSHSKCADELFLQTLIYQSPFEKKLGSHYFNDKQLSNMRKIEWSKTANNPNPEVWTIRDYDQLKKTAHLFARKFDLTVDSKIVEQFSIYLDSKKN